MRPHDPNRPSTHRLSLVLLCVSLAGCATASKGGASSDDGVDPAVLRMAAQLAGTAELRADLSAMKVCVHRIEGRDSKTYYGPHLAQAQAQLESIAIALEHEFMLALSNHMYLINTELATNTRARPTSFNLRATLDEVGATHAVVGHFVRDGDDLRVQVRLVEAEV